MLKTKNDVILLLFVSSFLKSLILRPSVYESVVLLTTGLVYSYLEYKNPDKKLKEIQELIKEQSRDINDLKERIGTIKIAQQIKPSSVSFRV